MANLPYKCLVYGKLTIFMVYSKSFYEALFKQKLFFLNKNFFYCQDLLR